MTSKWAEFVVEKQLQVNVANLDSSVANLDSLGVWPQHREQSCLADCCVFLLPSGLPRAGPDWLYLGHWRSLKNSALPWRSGGWLCDPDAGRGFSPWLGNWDPTSCIAKKKKISDTWVPPQRLGSCPWGAARAWDLQTAAHATDPAPPLPRKLVQLRVRRVATGCPWADSQLVPCEMRHFWRKVNKPLNPTPSLPHTPGKCGDFWREFYIAKAASGGQGPGTSASCRNWWEACVRGAPPLRLHLSLRAWKEWGVLRWSSDEGREPSACCGFLMLSHLIPTEALWRRW